MRRGTTLNDLMQWNSRLFEGITIPSEIDYQILVSYIMFSCGLQEVVYADWDVFYSQVHIWFAAHEWNIQRLVDLIKKEYEPLWNYNKFEDMSGNKVVDGLVKETTDALKTKGGQDKIDTKRDRKDKDTYGGIDTEKETTTFGEIHGKNLTTAKQNTQTTDMDTNTTKNISTTESETITKSVTAFNTAAWQDTEKTTRALTGNTQEIGNESKEGTVKDDGTIAETGEATKKGTNTNNTEITHGKTIDGKIDETVNETRTYGGTEQTDAIRTTEDDTTTATKESNHIYGNVGVTTTQKMFMEEYELLGNVNIYQWITNKFSNELMVGVYI